MMCLECLIRERCGIGDLPQIRIQSTPPDHMPPVEDDIYIADLPHSFELFKN
jgi:hypothetical protein